MTGRSRNWRQIELPPGAARFTSVDLIVMQLNFSKFGKRLAPYVREFNECHEIIRKCWPKLQSNGGVTTESVVGARGMKLIRKFQRLRLLEQRLEFPTLTGWTTHVTATGGTYKNLLGIVVELARDGWLWRIRECGSCKRWFKAYLRKQWFCSDRCWEKHFRSTPRGKAKRNALMKRLRDLEKERDKRIRELERQEGEKKWRSTNEGKPGGRTLR
jgi:hypothetical protein